MESRHAAQQMWVKSAKFLLLLKPAPSHDPIRSATSTPSHIFAEAKDTSPSKIQLAPDVFGLQTMEVDGVWLSKWKPKILDASGRNVCQPPNNP
jgi:hypothetical protein